MTANDAARPPRPTTLGESLATMRQLILLALGVLCFVVAVRGFIMPMKFLTGGVTGLSLLTNALLKWPVGLMTLLFNIPIFILGFRDVGRRFVIYSALAVVAFWLLVDHVPVPALTGDAMLASIFGGVFAGLGSALAVRAGGSLGGFDILGVVLNRRFSLGMGEAGLFLNGGLIAASALIGSPEKAMYTLASIYVSSRTLDALQSSRPRKAVLIISKQNLAIKERLLFEMARGVTILKAEGAYTGSDANALLCVITRYEMRDLRDIVKAEDPDAFVSVLEASDVIGRFKKPTAFSVWQKSRKGRA